jgi:tetratricopeptide (TPR) repeat protein
MGIAIGSSNSIDNDPASPSPSFPSSASASTSSMPLCPTTLMIQRRIASARQLLKIGTESNNVNEAEVVLLKACELLESWAVDYEDQQFYYNAPATGSSSASEDDNPFCTLLAQARHRYAQVCVLQGNLELACRLFLQVLLHDPDTLSPSALAMAWYDVGLIYTKYNKLEHALAALRKSLLILHDSAASIDETMNFFIQQAMKQVMSAHRDQQQQQQQQQQSSAFCNDHSVAQASSPWSVQFTMTTYNYDDEEDAEAGNDATMMMENDEHQYYHQQHQENARQQILKEAQRLIDPSVQHASAA